MPTKYKLPSSKKILVRGGEVSEMILSDLMKEAYNVDGLYAECRIERAMEDGGVSDASYKEFWDCYRLSTGNENLHPYDKKYPFSLGKAFVWKKFYEKYFDFLDGLSKVVVGDIPPKKHSVEIRNSLEFEQFMKPMKKRGRPKKEKKYALSQSA